MSDEDQNREATATDANEASANAPQGSTDASEASASGTEGSTDANEASASGSEGPTGAVESGVAAHEARADRPKKKRKKRRAEPVERDELDAAGMQRPAFVLDFPRDPELDVLVRAFEAGNFAFVREQAPRLAESSLDADVKAAARELARRIEPDPLVKFLLGVAVALFVVVVTYVYHSHGR
ncbi:MAG TPA: hypothetical protein VFQ35_19855 [Polyangiaceae bacterium]|nr:hypothetical protein [Polyangiaceae bacterium]